MHLSTSFRQLTCSHSSLVGTYMRACQPALCLSFGSAKILLSAGNRYANVFPLPVCALAITSLPSKAAGTHAACKNTPQSGHLSEQPEDT